MKRSILFAALAILSILLIGCNAANRGQYEVITDDTVLSPTNKSAIKVATCQFPITGDVNKNLDYILRQMKTAKQNDARVAHFAETALSGYAGADFDSFKGYDWDLLTDSTRKVMALAAELEIWVILGSSHPLTDQHKPHNSIYIINDRGQLIDRYDKRFCTGNRNENTGDLKNYTPGDHFTVFDIDGIRCGALICHDFRYDEIYRAYYKKNVRLMFHSFHNAGRTPEKLRWSGNILGKIVPPTIQAYAANNNMWISSTNSSRPLSCWPSFFTQPNGNITAKLQNNQPGVLISTVDTAAKFYDASVHWRDRAIDGVLHSGTLVEDPRSDNRTDL